MRWLMIVLLVSIVGLLAASAGVALHVIREHRRRSAAQPPAEKADDTESEEAP